MIRKRTKSHFSLLCRLRKIFTQAFGCEVLFKILGIGLESESIRNIIIVE